ncbi:MAG: YbhB/YbcL family Raf kinase inhibitor-like protein [Steroidobacteraceae bacterium]
MTLRLPVAASSPVCTGVRIGLLAAGMFATAAAGAAVPQWLFAIGHAQALAISMLAPAPKPRLAVTSPAFADGGVIPCSNTQYCGNIFPGLAWSPGPAGTQSYVVIMQGPGEGAEVSLHLTVFNIPGSVRQLPAGMTTPPAGARLGPNVHGLHHTYAGPHPHDKSRNEYHLQVFALDAQLHLSSSVTFGKLIAVMRGHVLAEGQLVGFAKVPAR